MRRLTLRGIGLACLAVLGLGPAGVRPAAATTYAIVTLADDLSANGNCTLREALLAARTNSAVDACPAGSAGAGDTIALGAGTYLLPLGVLDASSDDAIRIQGPGDHPPSAVLSGGGAQRIFDLFFAEGRLTLEDLELREGLDLASATPLGGAVRAAGSSLTARRVHFVANVARRGGAVAWYATGAPRELVLESCVFTQNEALHPDAADQAQGGAVWANPTGDAAVRIVDTDFLGNRAASSLPGDSVSAGALEIATEGVGSEVTLERVRFVDNVAESSGAGGSATAGAFEARLTAGSFRMEDLELSGNDLGLSPPGGYEGMVLFATNQANGTLDRLRLQGNGTAASRPQAFLLSSGQSIVRLRDALVASGADGLLAFAGNDATLRLDHLTVADNSGFGLLLGEESAGSLVLENSIVFGNGTDIQVIEGTPSVEPENLVGIDPLFVNAAGGDYSLVGGSVAVDSGNTSSTFMGPYDLVHGARIVGPDTDLGAFERGALFNDGFETGTTTVWGW